MRKDQSDLSLCSFDNHLEHLSGHLATPGASPFHFCFVNILYLSFQLNSTHEELRSSHKQLEEEMRELTDKQESVAHWEAQITEIIQW